MIRKEQTHSSSGYPKIRVGEIDTSTPFQSVKHAVNLFGEVSLSSKMPATKNLKPHSAEEHVYVRDIQHHPTGKELEKLKEGIRNAENTKAEALVELEKARKKANDLSQKLKAINESKEASLKVAEAANAQLEEANKENLVVNNADQNALKELSDAKQELTKVRQEYNESLQAKTRATHQVEVAENSVKADTKRARELVEEIAAVKKATEQVLQATMKGKELTNSKFDPKLIKHLQTKLSEKMSEISSLQKNVNDAKASHLENQRAETLELESAKESLQEVVEEENILHKLVDSLKLQLEKMRTEHRVLREKEAETESEAGKLNATLRKIKSELEICLTGESKARGVSDEIITAVNQVKAEKESAQLEAENLKKEAEKLVKEAEGTRRLLQESENLLKTTLEEAVEAKADEEIAVEKIRTVSEETSTARSSASECGARITLSRDEFESLSRKTQESEELTLLKVEAGMAQVEGVKAGEKEAIKKLEATRKEIEELKACTVEALKRADMSEAAKKAIECELKRWGEKERQMKADGVESRSLAENQADGVESRSLAENQADEVESRSLAENQADEVESRSLVVQATENNQEAGENFRIHHKIQKQKSEVMPIVSKKMEKRSSMLRKRMKPSFSSIFHRKKSQVDAGSPSHLF